MLVTLKKELTSLDIQTLITGEPSLCGYLYLYETLKFACSIGQAYRTSKQ
jgi:hypothetical protein